MRITLIFSCFLLIACTAAKAQVDTAAGVDSSKVGSQGQASLFTVSADDLDSDNQSQDVSGLLQASRDVFTATAGFNWGVARYRIRGLGSENTTIMINGIPVNNPERGFAFWSNWGGLNDVTRYPTQRTGLTASPFGFAAVGGYSNVNTKPGQMRPGSRVSYAAANRSYRHRLMLTHSTGMQENGWAFTLSGSRRWAEEGYVEGTFFDAWSYFAAAEKKINSRHSVSLTAFGTPISRGRNGITFVEAYELTGNNFYNPNWGYQNGEKRSARISTTHQPIVIGTHEFKIDDQSALNTSVLVSFGRSGFSRLNWFDAADPRPDYYRYLPSFFEGDDPARAEIVRQNWLTDENTRQLNWDHFYFANSKNLYTVLDADGKGGNNVTGNRSKYIMEERRNDVVKKNFNSMYNRSLSERITLNTGLMGSIYKSKNFKIVEDLLGGDFWLDIDQFAERDFSDPTIAQNNLDNPNDIIEVGDRFGWDYDIHINKFEWFGQLEHKLPKFESYVALNASHTSFWRFGHLRNGKFPDNSAGQSPKQNFFNYGVKGGTVYKLTGRHFLSVNGAYLTRAPFSFNAYLSPRTRDNVVDNLQSEEIISFDANYTVRYPNLKTRLTYYYTQNNNITWSRSFYHEQFNNFGNYIMTGLDHLHYGVELGIEGKIASVLEATGAWGWGNYLVNSRPQTTFVLDNSNEILVQDRTTFIENYRLGTLPQSAVSAGLRYLSPKYWSVGANFNYFYDIWLSFNPDRRTAESVGQFITNDPQWSQILDQTQLDNQYTVNLFAMKSWKIKDYYIRVNISANNVLNNIDFITGGFEQLRYDPTDIDRFPPRVSYLFGRSYFAMMSFQF